MTDGQTVDYTKEQLQPENSGEETAKVFDSTFLGIFDLLKISLKILKERFWGFAGIILLPTFISAILLLAGIFAGGLSLIPLLLSRSQSRFPLGFPSLGIGFIVYIIVAVLVILICQSWGQVALFYAAASETKIGIKEAFKKSWKKIFSFWWLNLLSGAVILGGYFLFLIPGLIFSVWFSLANFVLISENIGGMKALLKSREYVRGRWWAVAGRIGFISIVPTFTIMLLSKILTEVCNSTGLKIFGGIIGIIFSFVYLLLPFLIIIFTAQVYFNLKALKGDFEFQPSLKSKLVFIIIGIFGALVIPASIFLLIMSGVRSVGQSGQKIVPTLVPTEI